MKLFTAVLVCLFLVAGVAVAQSIDGKWFSERKMERDGQSFTITQTFDLKADGSKLGGTVTVVFGDQEPRKIDVKDGKINGNKFSFATVIDTPNGQFKSIYEGTVEGDTLKGTVAREGGQGRPFEAKRK